MIPKPYCDNFSTLSRAFRDGSACLLECRDRITGDPAYVVCAVNRSDDQYELVPFARLFDANPYKLLTPPGGMDGQSASC